MMRVIHSDPPPRLKIIDFKAHFTMLAHMETSSNNLLSFGIASAYDMRRRLLGMTSQEMYNSVNSEALRTLGEDLDLRGIRTFAIKCEANLFVVDAGYQSPPAATPVTLHYSPNDIEQLDRKARERGDDLSATRSFIYLSEILSSIATYVGNNGAHLLTLSNIASTETMPVIDIEYERVQSDRMFERLTSSAIYALCVRDHKRRGRRPDLNDNRYTRFSSLQERASGFATVIAEK